MFCLGFRKEWLKDIFTHTNTDTHTHTNQNLQSEHLFSYCLRQWLTARRRGKEACDSCSTEDHEPPVLVQKKGKTKERK